MKIQIRITHDIKQAHAYGWTKRHKLVEMFFVGKWRAVGFFTDKMIEQKRQVLIATKAKLMLNAGFTPEQAAQIELVN